MIRRAGGLALLLLLAGARLAQAHATLVSAVPAPGAQAPATLDAIRLTFDQALVPGSALALYTPDFQQVSGLRLAVDGAVLTAELAAPLPAGVYTVQWLAVSTDGHPTQGSYQFGVRAAPAGWPVVIGSAAALGVLAGCFWLWRRRSRA